MGEGEAAGVGSASLPDAEGRARARRGLAIFLALTLGGSAACEAYLIGTGDPITEHLWATLALMWVPGVASLLTRVWLREGLSGLFFRVRGPDGRRSLAVAWLFGAAVGLVAYGSAWLTGLDAFSAPKMSQLGLEAASPALKFAASLGVNLTLGTVLGAISAGGEELGWRGYMLPRLIEAGIPRPVLVSGVVWALWHAPLIAAGLYASGPIPRLSVGVFAARLVSESYVYARVTLASGSVLPAIVLHASWNAVIQGTFDAFTAGGGTARTTSIWTGESGLLVGLTVVALSVALTWRPFPVRPAPGGPPSRWLSLKSA